MKRDEAEMRHEIGIDRLMWGADYPHLEGAAPVHRQILRYVFGGLPEEDIRRIVGLNAVGLFGFDGDLLQRWPTGWVRPCRDLSRTISLDEFPNTFSWSLGRPVPLASAAESHRLRPGGESGWPSSFRRRCRRLCSTYALSSLSLSLEMKSCTRFSSRLRMTGLNAS